MRVKVTMACTECKQRNYTTMKNKRITRTEWNSASTVNSAKSIRLTEKRNNFSICRMPSSLRMCFDGEGKRKKSKEAEFL